MIFLEVFCGVFEFSLSRNAQKRNKQTKTGKKTEVLSRHDPKSTPLPSYIF
jgi:hypothetical protein